MADIFSRKKRSAVMSALRSRGNAATELRLLALFRAHRITGWRRGATLRRKGEGLKLKAFRVKPDFAFRVHRLAVFVDGFSSALRSTPRPTRHTDFADFLRFHDERQIRDPVVGDKAEA